MASLADFGQPSRLFTWLGAFVASGFLFISCASNWLFAASFTNNPLLAFVYGGVGVLTSLTGAYLPTAMLRVWEARRYSAFLAGLLLLPFCVAFSFMSAVGFASSVRDVGTTNQAALSANYKTTLDQVRDLEAVSRRTKSQQQSLDKLRDQIKTYRLNGSMKQADPQAAALDNLGIPNSRYLISLLFALLVELGSMFLFYIVGASR